MQLIRLQHNNEKQLFDKGAVVTWGSFDGVHRGHQQVLAELKNQAYKMGLPSVVIITEPLAKEFFSTSDKEIPPRLTGLRERLMLLAFHQVDYVICMRFNQELALTSAKDYVQNILLKQLNAKHIVLGDDSRFGHNRTGDLSLLKDMGDRFNFTVSDIPSEVRDSIRVSSTGIREAMQKGEMTLSESLLGHEYFISGRVVHGEKRGRELGFPTANINIKRQQSPLMGVYAVLLINEDTFEGHEAVTNIGMRPTFGGKFCLLEVHLLDYSGDLYGQHVRVLFKHKIRDEIRFDNIEALKEQIAEDVSAAKAFFNK